MPHAARNAGLWLLAGTDLATEQNCAAGRRLAAVAAEACGVDALEALAAMEGVEEVAGRFTVRSFGDVRARLEAGQDLS